MERTEKIDNNTTKYFLHLDRAAKAVQQQSKFVLDKLNFLVGKKLIKLEFHSYHYYYKIMKLITVQDINELSRSLFDKLMKREQIELRRIEKTVEFCEYKGCLVHYLLDYFNEPLSGRACNANCSSCHDQMASALAACEDGLEDQSTSRDTENDVMEITETVPVIQKVVMQSGDDVDIDKYVKKMKEDGVEYTWDARVLTRILCGTVSRLWSLSNDIRKAEIFEKYKHYPFEVVLESVTKAMIKYKIKVENVGDIGQTKRQGDILQNTTKRLKK